MKKLISNIRNIRTRFGRRPDYSDDIGIDHEGFVELTHEGAADTKAKIIVRPFALEDFADVKPILDALREGYTVCLINIMPLKEKDLTELKRAINKLKKTSDAIDGDIAGFGEDWLVITPSFAQIYRPPRPKAMAAVQEEAEAEPAEQAQPEQPQKAEEKV